MKKRLVVVDPSIKQAETDCFNSIVKMWDKPTTFHAPALGGLSSFVSEPFGEIAGIIVLGSEGSVNDMPSWQLFLEKWLLEAFSFKIPTLGICFGHQLIAKILGSEVGFVEPSKTKRRGLREVEISGSTVLSDSRGKLVISHNECVRGIPTGMRSVGKSLEFSNDLLEHKTLPILTLQPHPEATAQFLKDMGIPNVTAADLSYGNSLVGEFLKFVAKVELNSTGPS